MMYACRKNHQFKWNIPIVVNFGLNFTEQKDWWDESKDETNKVQFYEK